MIKSHTGYLPGVAFLVGSGRKLRPVVMHTDSRFRYAALLRYCTDYAFGFSMLDETGFYAPSVAHNAFPSRPWLRISVLHGHNPTVSKQLRYALSRESVCTTTGRGLRPLRCGGIRLGESCELHIVATGNGFIYALLLRGCDGIK